MVGKLLRLLVLVTIVEDQPLVEYEGVILDADVTVERLIEGIGASRTMVVEFRKEVRFEYADLTISAEHQETVWSAYYYQNVRRKG